MRACDGCRRRKIKCDHGIPCRKCLLVDIPCTYDSPVIKKGPKKSRSESTISQLKGDGWGRFGRTRLKLLIDQFFDEQAMMFSLVLDRQEIYEYLQGPATPETYGLLTSMSAATIFASSQATKYDSLGTELLAEAVKAYGNCKIMELMNQNILLTTFFIFSSYFNRSKFALAWTYLRESISFAQIFGYDTEKANISEKLIFFVLYVTERGVSLLSDQIKYPLMLRAIDFPELPMELAHFQYILQMAKLFEIVDDFMTLRDSNLMNMTTASALFSRLSRCQSDALVTDSYRADFLVTSEWLRILIQKSASMAHFEIAGDSVAAMSFGMPSKAVEVHGVGMSIKLSEILYSVADSQGMKDLCIQLTSSEPDTCKRINQQLSLIRTLKLSQQSFFSFPTLENTLQLEDSDRIEVLDE